jgi:hypothetical protein
MTAVTLLDGVTFNEVLRILETKRAIAPSTNMNNEAQTRAQHFGVLKSKYQATTYS